MLGDRLKNGSLFGTGKDVTKTDRFMWSGALDDSADGTYSSMVVNKVFAILEADKRRTPANDCYNTTRSTTGQAF